MAGLLKFDLVLSLQEMALRRVTVLLSSDYEMPQPFYFDEELKTWLNTNEDKVKYKISKLLIPELLKKELIDKVRHVSLEVGKWTKMHDRMGISTREIGFEKLYWTPAGTIDYKKTAEALLGYEVLDVEKRYKLACNYCLEDYIPLLWEELAEESKEYFEDVNTEPDLTECWPHILKGEFSELDSLRMTSDRNLTSFNQWAFEKSVEDFNKTAAEYFFLKLSNEEREVSVMRTTQNVLSDLTYGFYAASNYDVLCYLLSLMTPEQQMETIKQRPDNVLLCFFVASWQDLLVENADLIWPFLESNYDVLSEKILKFVQFGLCHPKSFREFFITSPLGFKKHFVHHESCISGKFCTPAYLFLDEFFVKEDSDSIECIFGNLKAEDRKAIEFHPAVLDHFRRSIWKKSPEESQKTYGGSELERGGFVQGRQGKTQEGTSLLGKSDPGELYESDASAANERKGQKPKLKNCCEE